MCPPIIGTGRLTGSEIARAIQWNLREETHMKDMYSFFFNINFQMEDLLNLKTKKKRKNLGKSMHK